MAALHEFLRLMVPKMLSHPIEPLTFLFFTRVATTLVAGSVTAVSFARNFQSVPVALIGVAISLAAFPAPVGRRGPPATAQAFARLVRTSAVTIALTSMRRRDRARRRGAAGDPRSCSAAASSMPRTSRSRRPCSPRSRSSVPFDALGNLLARSLYATHNTVLPLGGRPWPGSS